MKEQTFFFNLSEPLEFSKKGEFETTLSLEIAPPSPENYNLVMALSQKFFKATIEAQKLFSGSVDQSQVVQGPEDMSQDMQLEGIKSLLLGSSIPMGDYVDLLGKVLERTCKLDADTPMRVAQFNKIGIDDKNRLLYEYILNFIVPSVSQRILGEARISG